jgi:carbamoyl-phosphate synthase large subunit
MAAQPPLPLGGNIFISVKDSQKTDVAHLATGFSDLGFKIYATAGTAAAIKAEGAPVTKLYKLSEGRPNVLDMIKNGEISFIINTPAGKTPRADEVKIRSAAVAQRIPIMTTMRAARASLQGIRSLREQGFGVKCIQEFHPKPPGR